MSTYEDTSLQPLKKPAGFPILGIVLSALLLVSQVIEILFFSSTFFSVLQFFVYGGLAAAFILLVVNGNKFKALAVFAFLCAGFYLYNLLIYLDNFVRWAYFHFFVYSLLNVIYCFIIMVLFLLLAIWMLRGGAGLLRAGFVLALVSAALPVIPELVPPYRLSLLGISQILPRIILPILAAWFCQAAVNGAPAAAGAGGQPLPAEPQAGLNHKSRTSAAVLAFLLGSLGVHNFYLGYPGRGLAQLLLQPGAYIGALAIMFSDNRYYRSDNVNGWAVFFFILGGAVGVWVLVDLVRILTSSLQPANGPYREEYWKDQFARQAVSQQNAPVNPIGTSLDMLKNLRDNGVLSQEEYHKKVIELVDRQQT